MASKRRSSNGGHMLKPVPLDQDVYTLALERTAYVFDQFDHVVVSFSGGKDSTAVLQVALEVAHSHPRFARHLPLRTVFFDEEAIPYETEQYVRRISQRDDVALEWYCLPVRHRNACSRTEPYWWPWAPEARDKWCRPLPPEAITELAGFPTWPPMDRLSIPNLNGLLVPAHLGNVAMLMGIRAQESPNRRRAVKLHKVDNFIIKFDEGTSQGNVYKAYPIYDWMTSDVWTAPALHGWDYNRAYDLMEMAGVSAFSQRCSPAFGEEPIQRLDTYAKCFPDVWAMMAERLPGVGAALRYARTELYGFGTRPEKPAGLPWSEFLALYASKHGDLTRRQVTNRLRTEIRRHYRKTTHPILENTPHPLTGVSYKFLLPLAMRGDLKERRQAYKLLDNEPGTGLPTVGIWRRYAEELTQILAAGRFHELGHPGDPPADPWALLPDYARQEV
ncbi:phosphoadenosine phosphosulfate reductase domain-containing protein [Micromonospora sp. WMMC273]|uniref:phosphoadenosine phosphosulfate reductase domain-containing protein n=1 Tax=Micromonospora sp. WMMC273 TaxID=3015157 RepID=UPI0022B6F23C|nr:phosphoadenosine phosphosulfate reductase family protein [Micromonospora sp. WMMC273]MCZ7478809.1 phosphoadenosine phosphosulfate reductase family protein [Micromonospora sp. WMMC273]MCZ7478937.1 phosphoadenosine phosphosulfate reductase family protein [Micromonospora sp. WMMC273]MCZ7478998.1 phosphoadenosine phosphosulfate reductase family protein [Micromonospora sp. WMMC273]